MRARSGDLPPTGVVALGVVSARYRYVIARSPPLTSQLLPAPPPPPVATSAGGAYSILRGGIKRGWQSVLNRYASLARVPCHPLHPTFIHDPTTSIHNGEYFLTFREGRLQISVSGLCRLRYRQRHHHHRDSHRRPYHHHRQFYRHSECFFGRMFLGQSCLVLMPDSQVLVLIWDLFVDILCCRCCSGRRRLGTRRRFGRSSRF